MRNKHPPPGTEIIKTYFGCTVRAFIPPFPCSTFPWMFQVTYQNRTYEFAGIPNRCERPAQALRRGWWRAKWLSEGKWSQHYST